jgi:hypothetical protein
VSGDRRGVDDLAAVPALLESCCGGLDPPQHAFDVDSEDSCDFFGSDVGDRIHLCDTGVVDHDIESVQR